MCGDRECVGGCGCGERECVGDVDVGRGSVWEDDVGMGRGSVWEMWTWREGVCGRMRWVWIL